MTNNVAEHLTDRSTTPVWLDDPYGTQAVVLRQAVLFIEQNAHRPIGIADIAAACHRGPRALQLAFRRGADTTPWAYVRAVRLARARQDLLAGDPRTDTVFAVAHRWGFTNRSRFSAEYRAAYGEAPGATLRRPWAEASAA
ncbi:helix-turn-helix transcriptional regulator [uncultured Friedmanniella sp.]|uniref:helix-turn-helix transcriptional regulator n=1 Tax=uncultured Friedmanniella sp. TaxID=335381 RepID=UPI0035C9FA27